jgi:hypothetical protein
VLLMCGVFNEVGIVYGIDGTNLSEEFLE